MATRFWSPFFCALIFYLRLKNKAIRGNFHIVMECLYIEFLIFFKI